MDSVLMATLQDSPPPSTQAILAAQRTPPQPKQRSYSQEDSIIVISSSPLQSIPPPSPTLVFDIEDEQYFGPQRTVSSSPAPAPIPSRRRKSSLNECSIEVIEDESFARFVGSYKHESSLPSTDSASIPARPTIATRKRSLDGFIQETKPLNQSMKPGRSRVKTSLTTRIAIPSKPPVPRSKSPAAAAATTAATATTKASQASFFTTWAAAQAPMTRPVKANAKPRKKPTKKKEIEIVLLSPKRGQENVRKHLDEVELSTRRLGEKADSGVLWNACKRGLEGELYDCDGEIVFSQELRTESLPDLPLREIQVVSWNAQEESECVKESLAVKVDPPNCDDGLGPRARLKGNAVIFRDDGMPVYSTFTVPQLQNEVKKYGFKPSRSKEGMISLLEECWKATQKSAFRGASHPNNTNIITPVAGVSVDISSPTRRGGRRRVIQTTKSDVDQSIRSDVLRHEPVVVEDLVE